MENFIRDLKFDEKGLITAVIQNKATKEVLMVGYMNAETLDTTFRTGRATFWSRSRQKVWVKGETSGNYMYVDEIRVDCDADCLLILVDPAGPACHTGNTSCFYRSVDKSTDGKDYAEVAQKEDLSDVIAVEEGVIRDRKLNPEEGSYTNYLFEKGEDKILKKVGEEAAEVVIAGKNRSKDEITYETADLMYHLSVMLVDNDLSWDDVYAEMKKRRK